MSAEQIIVVRRRGRRSRGRHGNNAWKIAFADFTLSMMAVFLVLWVVSTATPSEKAVIGRYFSDPDSVFEEGGHASLIDMGFPYPPIASVIHGQPQQGLSNSSMPASSPLWGLMEDLEEAGLTGAQGDYQGNLNLEFIPQGIKIYISESEEKAMFDQGSKHLMPFFEDMLLGLAPYLAETGRALSITGHSDGVGFTDQRDMDNWYLSSYRANEARQTLIHGGFPEERIVQVAAMADRALVDKENPYNPINRRVEIVVMTADSEFRLTGVDFDAMSLVADSGDEEEAVETERVRREFDTGRIIDVRRLAEDNRMPGRG
ncbi:flagellar motor protein MotB [Endozoicomonas lisbonensis]|uniref:Chemotaxis protein MotB n=1 Tax=Endozoicomonas lisbonensis TaxID=3120522 RepID=A0ABV2SBH5_9GAMM